MTRRRCSLSVLLVSLTVGACVTIQQPPNNSSGLTNPVASLVTWNEDMQSGTFFANLDANDVTSLFQVDYANRQATASLTVPPTPTQHALTAGGSVWSPFGGYGLASSTNSFSISQPSFTLTEFQPGIGRGGRAIAVSVSAANTATAIVASESGGLFQSNDGGSTWPHVDSLAPFRMSDVAYVPAVVSNPKIVVATALADARTDPFANRGGIWVSDDDGVTWNHVAPPPSCASVPLSGFGIAFFGTNTVLVGTSCGLLVNASQSNANWEATANWSVVYGAPIESVVGHPDSAGNQIIDVCLVGGGQDRSKNGGQTWRGVVQSNPGPDCQSPHSIAASPLEPDVLLATFGLPNTVTSVVESDDGGSMWIDLHAGSNNEGGRNTYVATRVSADGKSDDFDLYFAGRFATCSKPAGGAQRCPNDIGDHWPFVPSSAPLAHDIVGIAFFPFLSNNCPMFMVADYGIYQAPAPATLPPCGDPSQWKEIGFGSLQIFQVIGQVQLPLIAGGFKIGGHTSLFFGTQDNGLWGTYDVDAASWHCLGSSTACDPEGRLLQVAPSVSVWPNGAQVTFDSTDAAVMQTVTVDGATGVISDESQWNAVTPPGNGSPPFAVSANTFVQWSNGTLFLTQDSAQHWVPVGTLPTSVFGPNGTTVPVNLTPGNFIQVTQTPAGSGVFDWVTDTLTGRSGLVFLPVIVPPPSTPRTFDVQTLGGITMSGPNSGGPSNFKQVWGYCYGQQGTGCSAVYAVDPNNFLHLYAVDFGQKSLAASSDGGATWTPDLTLTSLIGAVGSPMTDSRLDSQVHVIACDPADSSHILVGTDDAGLFASSNGGQTWSALAGTSRAVNISSLYFDDGANVVYVGTYGRGLWKLSIDWTTVN